MTPEEAGFKYQYGVFTWGGFYNEEYKSIHKKEEGQRFFDTAEERKEYIVELQEIEIKLNAKHLAMDLCEGYDLQLAVLHRVVEYKGKRYYTKNNQFVGFPYDVCEYNLKYKWYAGFNDYPIEELGEDEEAYQREVKVIQEWITGSFKFEATE